MLVPLVPSRRRRADGRAASRPGGRRAASRPGGRRAARWAAGVLLIAGALLAIASPALAATPSAARPHATQAAQAAQGTQAQGTQAAQAAQKTQAAQGNQGTHTPQAARPAQLTAVLVPSVPGGVCQVPGIGDIGGLVGLCSAGSSGIVGDLNNICEPSLPQPEQATGGIDAMVEPPSSAAGGKTLYDNYGVAGQFWAAHGLQCSDMTSLIGNNVAGMVFDAAKSVDRVTITVYQSAAGDSILNWLQDSVDGLITALGNAIYFPYLAPVVILGAMWLAWQGLIRKRATRTIEGTLWMVVAATAAIALIGRQADFTGIGTAVSNGTTQVLNTAFAKLPAPAGSDCLPVAQGDPQSVAASYAFTSGNGLVDQNANELWSVLVCKPWLYGELGTTAYAPAGSGTQTVVDAYGRQLLWSQAIAANETPTTALIQAKQATYTGIASSLQQNEPGIYPLFQGNQWTTRLEIAFAAMFAALVAGLLILLIALTLIVLKLGFLLLLVAGPFFLIIGIHPGFGRIIAIRWFEMLAGVLLKQVAIAIVLSVLLYCYSLIMGTADSVLPWALKILMIALVTVAVFIYRRPFTHLFSAVGYGTLGSAERAEYNLREAGSVFRRNTVTAASVAVPGVAAARAARWARRNPGQATAVAAGVAGGVGAAAAAAAVSGEAAAGTGTGTGQAAAGDGYASRLRPDAPPAADADGQTSPAPSRGVAAAGAGQDLPRNRHRHRPHPTTTGPATKERHAQHQYQPGTSTAGNGPASAAPTWTRGPRRTTASEPAPTRSRAPAGGSPGTRPARPASQTSRTSRTLGTNGTNGTNRTNGTNGTGRTSEPGSRQPAPAWPRSSWAGVSTAAGPRQRPATERRPAERGPTEAPAEPPGTPGHGTGHGTEEPQATPFWLRPVRRK